MKCPACGAENPPTDRFCGSCGRGLPYDRIVSCPRCGALIESSAFDCPKCGAHNPFCLEDVDVSAPEVHTVGADLLGQEYEKRGYSDEDWTVTVTKSDGTQVKSYSKTSWHVSNIIVLSILWVGAILGLVGGRLWDSGELCCQGLLFLVFALIYTGFFIWFTLKPLSRSDSDETLPE